MDSAASRSATFAASSGRRPGRSLDRWPAGRRLALLPANAAAADLLVGDPRVERDLGRHRRQRLGGGVDPGLVAEPGGELGEDLPARANGARRRDVRAQPLQPAVGMGHGALLLGVRLGR